jgi:hypothetical protein
VAGSRGGRSTGADVPRPGPGIAWPASGGPPLRAGGAVGGDGLRRAASHGRGGDQHGGSGALEENGYAEWLRRTIKEKEVALSEYEGFADTRRQLGRFLDAVYNHKWIHWSLGYLTLRELEQQWLKEQSNATAVP